MQSHPKKSHGLKETTPASEFDTRNPSKSRSQACQLPMAASVPLATHRCMSGSYLGATRRRGRVTEVATCWELRTATALQPSTSGKCSPQVCTDRLLRLMTVHLTPLPPQATFLDLPVSRPTKWSNSPPSFDPPARDLRAISSCPDGRKLRHAAPVQSVGRGDLRSAN